jgi:hypothetical protein
MVTGQSAYFGENYNDTLFSSLSISPYVSMIYHHELESFHILIRFFLHNIIDV